MVTPRPFPETVLVVDDTEFMARVLADMLEAEGYRVAVARDGPEALEIYERELPDLVTLDLVMPGMDGLEVLRRLKAMDPACRVVMVSAVGHEAKVLEAIQLGARNYVLKPVDKDKLLATVRKTLDEY
ncbi:MAG: response regulator [Candidatus Dadabacteria bacterium]|nr:MAG: response regulator [Candidatus Dadabacteria bacterium]